MKLTALCPCPKSGDFRSIRQKHGNAAGDHGHPATETTLGVLLTYGKAQAAPEAGESIDGLQGGIQVCGSHTSLSCWAPSQACDTSQLPQEAKSCCWVYLAGNSWLVKEYKFALDLFLNCGKISSNFSVYALNYGGILANK